MDINIKIISLILGLTLFTITSIWFIVKGNYVVGLVGYLLSSIFIVLGYNNDDGDKT